MEPYKQLYYNILIYRTPLNRNGLNNASNNCTFCYIPNGFRDKKKNQKVFILKENMKGHLGIPKKYVEEIADYNGLRYLSTFEWE